MNDLAAVTGPLSIVDTLLEQYMVAVRDLYRSLNNDQDRGRAIGECNRLYEGVWHHLDLARDAIAALGRDVTTFDGVRKQLTGAASFGVPMVEVGPIKLDLVASIASLGPSFSKEVAVSANLPGALLANAARQDLKSLVPEVDWVALRRKHDAEFVDLSSGRRMAGNVVLLVVIGAVLGVVLWIWSKF